MVQTEICLRCFLYFRILQNNRLMYSLANHERDKKSYQFEILNNYI